MSKNNLVSTIELNDVPAILNIAAKAGITANIIGKQGVGKSQIVKQYAETEKFDSVIEIRLGQMEVGDLVGLPAKVQDKDGSWKTVWARPDWWPTKGRHVIFLDEWNRAGTVDVIQAIFQLILDKRLHTHFLPEKCQVICAMNPADKGFMVNKIKDKALWDRMMHLNVVPTTQEFLKWAKNNINADLHDFVRAQSAVLGDKTFTIERREPSSRSIEMLSKLQEACTDSQWEKYGSTLAASVIGTDFGVQYIKFLADRDYKPLKVEEVCLKFSDHEAKIKKWTSPDNLRLDVLTGTLDNIIAHLNSFNTEDDFLKSFKPKNKVEVFRKNHLAFCSLLPVDLLHKHIIELAKAKPHLYAINMAKDLAEIGGEDASASKD